MMNLLLAIAMLAQVPETTLTPTEAEVARLDLGFAYAVEDSIAREPGMKIPSAYAGLIALLGCDSYRGRVDATTRLESAVRHDPSALRWVFWGRRNKDPEIKSRCNGVVRRSMVCPSCKGSGRSKSSWGGECGDCHVWDGDGYVRIPIWPYSPWD